MIQRVGSEPLPVYVLSCRKWESWKGRASVPAFFFEKFVEFSPAAHLKIQISERGKKPHSDKTSCAVGAPPRMKIEFSGLVRGDGSVCGTSNAGWRLLGGRESACGHRSRR